MVDLLLAVFPQRLIERALRRPDLNCGCVSSMASFFARLNVATLS